jgi:hypothetical protein
MPNHLVFNLNNLPSCLLFLVFRRKLIIALLVNFDSLNQMEAGTPLFKKSSFSHLLKASGN